MANGHWLCRKTPATKHKAGQPVTILKKDLSVIRRAREMSLPACFMQMACGFTCFLYCPKLSIRGIKAAGQQACLPPKHLMIHLVLKRSNCLKPDANTLKTMNLPKPFRISGKPLNLNRAIFPPTTPWASPWMKPVKKTKP